ncbi:MAG: winged helix-turn-helix domain-containing protein [bacterium]|nr:winged helix-turn-helix domain-containing protein [bacterium]
MKQSYYDLLHEAKISWTKIEKTHPDHDPEKVLARREELQPLCTVHRISLAQNHCLKDGSSTGRKHFDPCGTMGDEHIMGRENTPDRVRVGDNLRNNLFAGTSKSSIAP